MQAFYVITNGIHGGLSTIRFNDREAVLVHEDEALALAMMKSRAPAALVKLEAADRRKAGDKLGSLLSAAENARIEFLFPDAEEYLAAGQAVDVAGPAAKREASAAAAAVQRPERGPARGRGHLRGRERDTEERCAPAAAGPTSVALPGSERQLCCDAIRAADKGSTADRRGGHRNAP